MYVIVNVKLVYLYENVFIFIDLFKKVVYFLKIFYLKNEWFCRVKVFFIVKNLLALLSGVSLGDLILLEGLVRYLYVYLKLDNYGRLK